MAKVRDVLVRGEKVPKILSGAPALEAVRLIDESNVGFVLITDTDNVLLGILTDGDVRRCVRRQTNFGSKTVDDLMTKSPLTIDEGASLAATLEIMEKKEITALVVVDGQKRVIGYVHLHDILGRGGTIRMSINGG
jgi:arabinose-5-phosphate isomerase